MPSGEEKEKEQSQEQEQEQDAEIADDRPLSIVHGPRAPVPLTMTFGELLEHHAAVRGNMPAVISDPQDKIVSFKQLRDRSVRLASAMARAGIGKGDLVAICMGSRVEYFEVFFACAKLGAALILLNYAFQESEMVPLLKSTGPKMFFSPPGFQHFDYTQVLPKLLSEVAELQTIVLVDDIGDKYHMTPSSDQYVAYEEFIDKSVWTAHVPKVDISPHDMVNVQFTSGSTGLPKNVALSHYNIMNCGRYIWLQTRMKDTDRICLPVPLFHSFGMIVGISTSAVAGSALVLPSELFDSQQALQCIDKYRCTALYGVPTMFINEMAHKDFATTDRSSLKFAVMAGSAMPPELLRRCIKEFPLPRVYTCWGMTELSSFVTMMHESDSWEKQTETAGRLFPHFSAKIVKPGTGTAVPWGDKGEIVVAGYGQMSSYMGNKEKTEEALQYHSEDLQPGGIGGLGDGTVLRRWMHTGDEGFLDKDGYFVISGRIKDIIIRGGENISPMEIEERLIENPAIEQASVIGVPDEKYGENIATFLELAEGQQKPSDDEVKDWVRQKLSRFKAPAHIWWLGGGDEGIPDDWPKTASGKISKPDLRNLVKSKF